MNTQSQSVIAVVLTGIWVNASEFFRNEVLLKNTGLIIINQSE